MAILRDQVGRQIRKLRVSLLDACQFRCFYCMPANPKFLPTSSYLSPLQIFQLCKPLVERGITHIRLTGGEPTLRRDFREIVTLLSRLPVTKLALTTNGLLLESLLDFLEESACRSLNVSIDSLQPEKFNKLVRYQAFDQVLGALFKAKDLGFQVKINTVLLKGINDNELDDFVNFAQKHDIEVRFLELMKIGQVSHSQPIHFLSAADAIKQISQHQTLCQEISEFDSTAVRFKTASGARIGFIASETMPFCQSCSRLRLSATGKLRACLMAEDGVALSPNQSSDWDQVLSEVMAMKPTFRRELIGQDMNQIGG